MCAYWSARAAKRKATEPVVVEEITSLPPYTAGWKLRVRIVFKSCLPSAAKAHFILVDCSGFIVLDSWEAGRADCELLRVGGYYEMEGIGTKAVDDFTRRYSWVRHARLLNLEENRVKFREIRCVDSLANLFTFHRFERLADKMASDAVIDVIGHVDEYGEVRKFVDRNGKAHEIVDVTLSDEHSLLVALDVATSWRLPKSFQVSRS